MRKQFGRINVPFRFLDAIRPDLSSGWPAIYDRNARRMSAIVDLRPGEMGCYMSHRQAWLEFIESSEELCCIVEDDVAIEDDFTKTVLALCENRESWDLVRYVWLFCTPFQEIEPNLWSALL